MPLDEEKARECFQDVEEALEAIRSMQDAWSKFTQAIRSLHAHGAPVLNYPEVLTIYNLGPVLLAGELEKAIWEAIWELAAEGTP